MNGQIVLQEIRMRRLAKKSFLFISIRLEDSTSLLIQDQWNL